MTRPPSDRPTARIAADWQRLFDLFGEVLDLPAIERQPWLEDLATRDPGMAAGVRDMLAAHLSDSPLELERVVGDAAFERTSIAGTRVGPYRLLRLLGRGGMGEVHLAERVDGTFEQMVAIKILRAALFGQEAVQRFHRERNLQARLTHPAIVPIIDGGVAPDGRPYLVMPLVEGVPITEFADRHTLSVKDRVRLLVEVGRAVEHAHSRLIVHRDLKPANILVTDDGAVRLMDFGIAKLLDADDAGTELTRTKLGPMTPGRAAPEQLRGEPPSTSTDVWGLGVLLHELLTSRLPFEGTSPASVSLRGDLERIVNKALAAQPEHRYLGVSAFNEDLIAWSEGRPVSARPASLAYRARRFVARHRAATSAAAVAVIALSSLVVGSLLQSARVARERDRATLSERQSLAAVELLVGLFGQTDPRSGSGVTTVAIADLLAEGERRVNALADQPALQVRLWHTLAAIHFERSERQRAMELYERALEMPIGQSATDPHRVALVADSARALRFAGKDEEARRRLADLLSLLEADRSSSDEARARVLQDLGEAVGGAEGAALIERALALQRAARPANPTNLASSLHALAIVVWRQGDIPRARALWTEALPLIEAAKGPDNPETRSVLGALANVLEDPREQEAIHRRILTSVERQMGPEAVALAFSWTNLGVTLALQGRYLEAESAFAEALRRWEKQVGPTHGQTLNCLRSVARLRDLQGKVDEALAVYSDLRRRRDSAGTTAPSLDVVIAMEAELLTRAGRLDEARSFLLPAMERLRADEPESSLALASAELSLGRLELASARPAAALEAVRRGEALRVSLLPATSPDLAEARAELGRALIAAGDRTGGRELLAANLPAFAANRRAHPEDIARLRAALDETAKGSQSP